MASAPRRSGSPGRLIVIVTTPDGGGVSPRGLSAWLAGAAPARARGEVTVALISDRRMRSLNRTFRGQDYATDVLSFPTAGARPTPADARPPTPDARSLGDVVIATGVAARQAKEAGHSVATELRVLALHGLLHLLGYDHARDAGQMARVEKRLRRAAGLKDGLIERSR